MSYTNLLRALASLVLVAAVLFVSTGQWDLPFFWAYLAVNAALMAGLMAGVDPQLMEERWRAAAERRQLLPLVLVGVPLYVGYLAVAGLDAGRFHWSKMSPGLRRPHRSRLLVGALSRRPDGAVRPLADRRRGPLPLPEATGLRHLRRARALPSRSRHLVSRRLRDLRGGHAPPSDVSRSHIHRPDAEPPLELAVARRTAFVRYCASGPLHSRYSYANRFSHLVSCSLSLPRTAFTAGIFPAGISCNASTSS